MLPLFGNLAVSQKIFLNCPAGTQMAVTSSGDVCCPNYRVCGSKCCLNDTWCSGGNCVPGPSELIALVPCPDFLSCGSACCSAGTTCTGGICVDPSLQCKNVASGTCDDGNNCTENDICYKGKCIGATCDDHKVCTTDTCGTAGCVHTPLNCDDGNKC